MLLFAGGGLYAQAPLPDAPRPAWQLAPAQQEKVPDRPPPPDSESGTAPSPGEPQSSPPAAAPSTPAPLSVHEKFMHGIWGSISPLAVSEAAVKAAFYQQTGFRRRYGTGTTGYFKQFGASLADGALRSMSTDFVYCSLLRQDPRYFRLGRGGVGKRMAYALSRVLIIRSDTGKNQFNWSGVLGSATAAGVSNVYLPQQYRTAKVGAQNFGWFLAGMGVDKLFQEFFPRAYRGLSRQP